MARTAQDSGGGWATSRLVGSLGRIPITSQKWLRGKNDKSYHGKQYKKVLVVHSKQQQ